MKKLILTAAVCSVACVVLSSCGGAPKGAKPEAEYPIATLDTSSAVIYNDFAAEIKSGTVVEIRARVSGYIDKILVQEGGHVEKGQAIFQIDQADLLEQYNSAVANVEGAQAKVDNATLEVRKLTPLVEKGIISPFELDNAKSNLTAAEASHKAAVSQMNNAKISLGYARITSPVNGVVGRIVVREGTLVSPADRDALTSVSGDGDVSAYFSIDENTILDMSTAIEGENLREKVSRMQQVDLILSNGTKYDYKGRLELASGLVDATTGSYQMKAVFTNPNNELRSGSSGVVRLSETMHGVIRVPQKATYEMQDKKMVYMVDDSSNVRSQSLVIEGSSGSDYVVSGGVNIGERIVLEGVDFIKEGDKIGVKN